jgi:mono/diheme cytochrome c family protein
MWRCSAVLGALAALLLAGCERYPSGGDVRIRRDMVDQPSFRPQEDPRPPAEGSIPVKGWEQPMTLQEAEQRLANPTPADKDSLEQGERLYRITCTPCHGVTGVGDGRVAAKMMKAANLTEEKYVRAKDGFIYGVIRNGSGMMPPHAESLSPAERWHVVNYVRKLQRR